MLNKYKFTFKKDDTFVEYVTTDKESLARQFQIWVTCASIYTYQHKNDIKEESKNSENIPQQQNINQPIQVELQPEPLFPEENNNITSENKITLNNIQNQALKINENEFFDTSINIETKSEQEILKDKKQEILKQVEQAGEISNNLNELYNKNQESTVLDNFIEDLDKDDNFSNNTDDFDKILENSMNNIVQKIEVQKDERFLKILNVKNISTKLEYLIVTAYYLSEFEKLDKFTLKLLNAKLMQNLNEAVDHNTLQEAIDKNLVEALPSMPEISGSIEYRLTNSGEEAFLNGLQF